LAHQLFNLRPGGSQGLKGEIFVGKKKEINWQEEIAAECIECGACSDECLLLTEIGEEPASIAARNIEADEAFGCSMCMLCESVCPLDLSPGSMFAQKRIQAVADGEIDIDDYRYLFPDRSLNIMSFFRQYYGIDYTDIEASPGAEVGFFPGCTMMTYSEQLTRRVYDEIKKSFGNVILLNDCCGKPLYQLGLPARSEANRDILIKKTKSLGLKKIVAVCPNCFYH
jgi:fumarate reductase (CoM/CoB) subunit B